MPVKRLPGLVNVDELKVASVTPAIFLELRTVSAVNTGNPDAFCATDLISLIP